MIKNVITNISKHAEILGIAVLHCTGNKQHPLFREEHYCASSANFCALHDQLRNQDVASQVVFHKADGVMFFNGVPIYCNRSLDFISDKKNYNGDDHNPV
jgi:hypothetical protein